MKREAIGHTKMKRLCRRLDIPLWQGVGLLESIWHLTAREAPRGDIGKLSDEDIALAIDYRGDESKLIEALIASGWLDRDPVERLVIHDWADHTDDAVHMRLARARLCFVGGHVPKVTRLPGKEREAAHEYYRSCAPEHAHKTTVSAPGVNATCAQNAISCVPPEPEPEPSPVPEPDTHTPEPGATRPCVSVIPRAVNLDGPISERFDEIWQRWPRKEQRDRALRDWLSFVTAANESSVMACAERYLASDEVARGVVKHLYNWLEQQHRDGWAGDWPRVRERGGPVQTAEQRRQAEIERQWQELGNGTSEG